MDFSQTESGYAASFGSDVEILQLVLVQTGTYQSMHTRPFDTHIDNNTVNSMLSITNGGKVFNPEAMSTLASGIIRPSASVEGQVNIPHGWNQRRFRFMMRVRAKTMFSVTSDQEFILFGFTDHCDASINHLDPRMRFYFNSEATIVRNQINTPMGLQTQARVVSNTQVMSPFNLGDDTPYGISAYGNNSPRYLIRPEDVFKAKEVEVIDQKVQFSPHYEANTDVEIIDTRTTLCNGSPIQTNKRRNAAPVRYLNDLFRGMQFSQSENAMDGEYGHVDQEQLYGSAQVQVASPKLSTTPFFRKLQQATSFAETGFVTLTELEMNFPEASERTTYSMDTGQSIRRVNMAQDSEVWAGADNTAIAVNLLAQVIPGIMMDNMIVNLNWAATNGNYGEKYIVNFVPDGVRSIVEDLDLRTHVEEVKRRLEFEVLNAISMDNQIPFSIVMDTNLSGDSVIDISLDGGPSIRYVAPTFSDSLFTNLSTTRQDHSRTLSNDMDYLVTNVLDRPVQSNVGDQFHQPVVSVPNHHHPMGVGNVVQSGPTHDAL